MMITFPHMGNIYICIKAMLDDLGVDYIIPPFNNKKALEIGARYAPELACLPLKINIGNLIQAYEQGADTVLMAGGRGPCRFGYYCEMHREILKDSGYDMDVISLELPYGSNGQGIKAFMGRMKKLTGGFDLIKIIKVIKNTAQTAKQVDEIERLCFKLRPVEKEKGAVDNIYKVFKSTVLISNGSAEIKKLIKTTKRKLLEIEADNNLTPLRVGIVGEIYTTIDISSSFDIEIKLGNMGIEVDRNVTISGWIIDHIIKNALHLKRDLRYIDASRPYLKTMIGGHAQETIGNTVLYSKQGYDGVIQIYPLTCMPEIVAESILPAVEKDYDIPVLKLIIDEMTGEAGYMTRLEAFIDLLHRRREGAAAEKGKYLLPGC